MPLVETLVGLLSLVLGIPRGVWRTLRRIGAWPWIQMRRPLFILCALLSLTVVILVLAILATRTLAHIDKAVYCSRPISIDVDNGGTYSSCIDHPELCPDGRRIDTPDEPWEMPHKETVVPVSWDKIPNQKKQEHETAGAYLLFYDDPVPLSDFDSLSFSISSSGDGGGGDADIIVALVVDDPNLPPKEREVVVRESPSVEDIGQPVSSHWERITIDLGEFALQPFRKPAEHIDPDRVNKIVFFVDNDIVDRFPSGRVRVKDISFGRRGSRGGCP